MLVARSFSYGATSRSTSPKREVEKKPTRSQESLVRGFGWRPDSFKRTKSGDSQSSTCPSPPVEREVNTGVWYEGGERDDPEKPKLDDKSDVAPDSVSQPHSKPVAVPTRSLPRPVGSKGDPRATGKHKSSYERRRDSEKMSPSVAALLASTSIPKRKASMQRGPAKPRTRKLSIDELVHEWRKPETLESGSLSSSPNMELLLSPPEEANEMTFLGVDDADDDVDDVTDDGGTVSGSAPSRSLSSNSIPSLDIDGPSLNFSSSNPTTLNSNLRVRTRGSSSSGSSLERKPRSLSLPKSIESGQDHPLRNSKTSSNLSDTEEEVSASTSNTTVSSRACSPPSERNKRPVARRKDSSKSNLTASLQSLRTTITRSFSNFSAPPSSSFYPPSDHLSRSFFGQPPAYNPEMRPKPLEGVPSPELRRYLNPQALHLHNLRLDDDPHLAQTSQHNPFLEPAAPSLQLSDAAIPLQPYNRPVLIEMFMPSSTSLAGERAGSLPDITDSSDGASPWQMALEAKPYSQQQRREPRENPEFLRIAVLEIAMRRAGKLEGGARGGGRRGWWLPPREVIDVSSADEGPVPRRWRAEM